ncbi:uncharacterized protein OCT59_016870 [Rhizophagus irregularis]|uniref:uncharacterized protein n=1 Tax=Rhizophagus irregularis TaxID=588596 RepID=UPI00331AB796|nr:hypothetical protein OCT59_016870 [Rhizophagus irregularis]
MQQPYILLKTFNSSDEKERTRETVISATSERGIEMDGTGSRWYDDSSKRCGMASHLDQLSTLNNALREKGSESSHSSWKSKRQRAKKISFGASLMGSATTKPKLLNLRQKFDSMNQRMLPRDTNGNLLMKMEE